MTQQVEVFYTFQSPYSYLALEAMYDMEKKFDIELLWQPFSAKATGQQPPSGTVHPDKFTYLVEDTKRFAEKLNLPLVYPENWPNEEFDPSKICRGALVASDLGVLMEYNYKVFQHCWGEGLDPNTEEFTAELCEDLDIEIGEYISKSAASEIRQRLRGIYSRGRKLGVFDTPTIVIEKERFYGIDKIGYVEDHLRSLKLAR